MSSYADSLLVPRTSLIKSNFTCFFAMVMWAFVFPAAEVLLESWSSMALVLVRHSISVFILLLIWMYLDGWSRLATANWIRGIGVGGIGFGIGAILFLVGQDMSDAVTPAIAASMMPIVGAVLEVVLDERRMRPKLLTGIVLAIIGGLMATGTRFDEGNFGWGSLLCLLSVLLFAWATRDTTKNFPNLSSLGRTTITMTGGLVTILLIYLVMLGVDTGETQIGATDSYHLAVLVLSAVFASALAQFLWIRSNAGLGILLASFHMNAVPFYVMVILVLFLDANWNWWQAAGAAVVGFGVWLAQSGARGQS